VASDINEATRAASEQPAPDELRERAGETAADRLFAFIYDI
jgi:hypothetical protein